MAEEQRTLGFYRDIAKVLIGEDSKAVAFLDKRIESNPNGRDEVVVQAESQMMYLICNMDR